MSNLTLLPLVRVSDGVQPDEDWRFSIAFYLDDAVTPIGLTGLTFTVSVGSFATLTTASGQISVTGPSNNVLALAVLKDNKASWPTGVHDLSLAVTDGAGARELFAYSTLSVGSPQSARVSLINAPDTAGRPVAAALPAALVQAFQALQPGNMASELAHLSSSQLVELSQALFAALPVQTGSNAPVISGQAFINQSGYVVIAQ